jgi:hypothetical protein
MSPLSVRMARIPISREGTETIVRAGSTIIDTGESV